MSNSDNLLAYDLKKISEGIKKGIISPVTVAENTIERIQAMDPLLNSYISVDCESAMQQAIEKEEEIKQGKYRGPLHGIPIGLKDNIDVEGIVTTAGSAILANAIAKSNAPLVDCLKEAGAVLIGKQNMHQIAYGPTGDRSSHGPARNPHHTGKMTGGSSSGSAAAVSAYLCFGSIGTDTGGSIRIPASFCGIVGMKPTYGRVSKRGVYPLSWTLDHAGPLSRTVLDNALILNVIAGYDADDPDAVFAEQEDFTRYIPQGIEGMSIGIPDHFYFDGLHDEVAQAIEQTIEHFEQLGANILPVKLPDMQKISDAQKVILQSDAYAFHGKNLTNFPDDWDDEVKERLLTALDTTGYDYANALQIQKKAIQQFNPIWDEVDVLLTPTMSILPPDVNERYVDGQKEEHQHIRWVITKLTAPTNLLGLPSLSIPCGYSVDGLPIGVQLIGKKFDEARLYQFGHALEQKLSLNKAKPTNQ